jgi:hypothetical protein
MPVSLSVWLKAQGIYALITLPVILIPPMYMISELYALVCGIPVLILFSSLLLILKKQQFYNLTLIAWVGISVTVACTYAAAWHFADFKNPLKDFIDWIIFPALGCLSAILSILFSQKKLKQYILNETDELDIETTAEEPIRDKAA